MDRVLIFCLCVPFLSSGYSSTTFEHQTVFQGEIELPARSSRELVFAFAEGDSLFLEASVVKGNDISRLEIMRWDGPVIYSSSAKPKITAALRIPRTTGIIIEFTNTALFRGKLIGVTITRKPTRAEYIDFDTQFRTDTLYDTTWTTEYRQRVVKVNTISEDVVNTTLKLGARLVGPNTRTTYSFKLPEGTSQWAYWVGLEEAYSYMKDTMGDALKVYGAIDPVGALALNLVSNLVVGGTKNDIHYYIADSDNASLFMDEEAFRVYYKGKNIIADYKLIKDLIPTFRLYFCLDNSHSTLTEKTVILRVVAVKLEPQYETYEVKVPHIKMKIMPKWDKEQ